jgi:tetratricopeptide (TPR) repeat protein
MQEMLADTSGGADRGRVFLSYTLFAGLLFSIPFFLPGTGFTGADTSPPSLRIVEPATGTEIGSDTLTVEIEYRDAGSGIAAHTLHVVIDGKDYAGQFDQHNRGASGSIRMTKSLPTGEHRMTVEVADRAGNVAHAQTIVKYARPPTRQDTVTSQAQATDPYNDGIEHVTARRWKEAVAAFEKAAHADPKDVDARVKLGRAYLEVGQYDDSITAFRAASLLNSQDGEIYAGLGTALAQEKRWKEAAEAWGHWATLDRDNALAFFRLGYAQLVLKQYEQAAASFRQTIAINPRADGAYTNLGIALHALKQYQESIAAYEQAVDFKSELPETYFGLALVYTTVGERSAAQKQLSILRALDAGMAQELEDRIK